MIMANRGDYELLQSAYDKAMNGEDSKEELLDPLNHGFSIGVCDDETGETLFVVPPYPDQCFHASMFEGRASRRNHVDSLPREW
jgi:hypothetical protein